MLQPADPSDFEEVIPVNVGNSAAEINMFIPSDQITLEYNDTVILRFTSTIPDLITGLESEGEYIRSSVMVHIIDHDSK